jgi:hypothetical protein
MSAENDKALGRIIRDIEDPDAVAEVPTDEVPRGASFQLKKRTPAGVRNLSKSSGGTHLGDDMLNDPRYHQVRFKFDHPEHGPVEGVATIHKETLNPTHRDVHLHSMGLEGDVHAPAEDLDDNDRALGAHHALQAHLGGMKKGEDAEIRKARFEEGMSQKNKRAVRRERPLGHADARLMERSGALRGVHPSNPGEQYKDTPADDDGTGKFAPRFTRPHPANRDDYHRDYNMGEDGPSDDYPYSLPSRKPRGKQYPGVYAGYKDPGHVDYSLGVSDANFVGRGAPRIPRQDVADHKQDIKSNASYNRGLNPSRLPKSEMFKSEVTARLLEGIDLDKEEFTPEEAGRIVLAKSYDLYKARVDEGKSVQEKVAARKNRSDFRYPQVSVQESDHIRNTAKDMADKGQHQRRQDMLTGTANGSVRREFLSHGNKNSSWNTPTIGDPKIIEGERQYSGDSIRGENASGFDPSERVAELKRISADRVKNEGRIQRHRSLPKSEGLSKAKADEGMNPREKVAARGERNFRSGPEMGKRGQPKTDGDALAHNKSGEPYGGSFNAVHNDSPDLKADTKNSSMMTSQALSQHRPSLPKSEGMNKGMIGVGNLPKSEALSKDDLSKARSNLDSIRKNLQQPQEPKMPQAPQVPSMPKAPTGNGL